MFNYLNKLFWNLQSYSWDNFLNSTNYLGEIETILNVINKYVRINKSKILDLGCATGSYSIEFAKAGAYVTGIDYATKMLDIANKKVKSLCLSNIKFINDDINNFICKSNGKYDIIIAAHIFPYFFKAYDSIQKLKELLSENGIIVIVHKTKHKTKRNDWHLNFTNFLILILRKLLFSKRLADIDTIKRKLKSGGFSQIGEFDSNYNKILIYNLNKK